MNNLLWGVQILLAGVFLFTAAGKLFDYEQLVRVIEGRSRGKPIGMARWQAIAIGLAEIMGALGLLMPERLNVSYMITFFSAAFLAFIMVGAGIYHLRRSDSAIPPVVLFLLALFLVVGRWPK